MVAQAFHPTPARAHGVQRRTRFVSLHITTFKLVDSDFHLVARDYFFPSDLGKVRTI